MQRTSQVHFQHFINLFGLVLILTHGLDPQNFFPMGRLPWPLVSKLPDIWQGLDTVLFVTKGARMRLTFNGPGQVYH